MNEEHKLASGNIVRKALLLQLKLLLSAGRDLLLVPVALVAAGIDLVNVQRQQSSYFRQVLRFGRQTDEYIDVWSDGVDTDVGERENVDKLLQRVEGIVRDPSRGKRHARVLKRWAERQVAQARSRATAVQPDQSITVQPAESHDEP